MSEKSILSNNLVNERNLRGWNLEGAARVIGIKRASLGHYETGKIEPPADVLEKICQAYEIEDIESFKNNPDYHNAPKLTAEDIYSKYIRLPWAYRIAINTLLDLSNVH